MMTDYYFSLFCLASLTDLWMKRQEMLYIKKIYLFLE